MIDNLIEAAPVLLILYGFMVALIIAGGITGFIGAVAGWWK